jgi:hypothetical protein
VGVIFGKKNVNADPLTAGSLRVDSRPLSTWLCKFGEVQGDGSIRNDDNNDDESMEA